MNSVINSVSFLPIFLQFPGLLLIGCFGGWLFFHVLIEVIDYLSNPSCKKEHVPNIDKDYDEDYKKEGPRFPL